MDEVIDIIRTKLENEVGWRAYKTDIKNALNTCLKDISEKDLLQLTDSDLTEIIHYVYKCNYLAYNGYTQQEIDTKRDKVHQELLKYLEISAKNVPVPMNYPSIFNAHPLFHKKIWSFT